MDGADGTRRWANIKHRLALKAMMGGCCCYCGCGSGALLSSSSRSRSAVERLQEDHHRTEPLLNNVGPFPSSASASASASAPPPPPGMNLATALAAERNSRVARDAGPTADKVHVKSLTRLIEETDGPDYSNKRAKRSDGRKGGDTDWVCCVCMERNKGAAFVPCGHAFCRMCSRELRLSRGSCPMCNTSITEILDIY